MFFGKYLLPVYNPRADFQVDFFDADSRLIHHQIWLPGTLLLRTCLFRNSPLFRMKIEFLRIYHYVFSHLLSVTSNSVISNFPLFQTHWSSPTHGITQDILSEHVCQKQRTDCKNSLHCKVKKLDFLFNYSTK